MTDIDPFGTPDDGAPVPAGAPAGWTPKPPAPRGRWGWYKLTDPTDQGSPEQLWRRATTFAKTTADSFAIGQWQKRMVALGLSRRPDLLALAASLTSDQRAELDDVCERATVAAGSDTRSNLGTALHTFTEIVDSGATPEFVPEFVVKDLDAYVSATRRLGLEFSPEWIEGVVVNKRWTTAGTLDRIVRATRPLDVSMNTGKIVRINPGDLLIGDLKTGGSATKVVRGKTVDADPGEGLYLGWQEIEVQLAEYAYADGVWDTATNTWSPMPPVRRDVALVFHVPSGSGICHVLGVDLVAGAEAADLCAAVLAHRSAKVRPSVAAVARDPFDMGPPADTYWPSRFQSATTRGELISAWDLCRSAGAATPELQATVRRLSKDLP